MFVLALGLVVAAVAQLVTTPPHDARLLGVVILSDLVLVALFGTFALEPWVKLFAQRAREEPSSRARRAIGESSTSFVEWSRGLT